MRTLFSLIFSIAILGYMIFQGVTYYQTEQQNEIIGRSNAVIDDLQELIATTAHIYEKISNSVDLDYVETDEEKEGYRILKSSRIGDLKYIIGGLQKQVNKSRDNIAQIEILDTAEGNALKAELRSFLNIFSESSLVYDGLIHKIQVESAASNELYNEAVTVMNAEDERQNTAIEKYNTVKDIYTEN